MMVQAYRLLVNKMMEENMNYPMHIGVTEAGEAEDGRIKSSVGIGALLEDGIGDTVRVSLTEEPEFEVPVAVSLVSRYNSRGNHQPIEPMGETHINPFQYTRRGSAGVMNIGGHNVPRVLADMSNLAQISKSAFLKAGYSYSEPLDKWNLTDIACDYIYLGDNKVELEIPGTLGLIYNSAAWKTLKNFERVYPLFYQNEYFDTDNKSALINFVSVDAGSLTEHFINKIKNDSTAVLVFDLALGETNSHGMAEQRRMFVKLMENNCTAPVIIKRNYGDISSRQMSGEEFMIYSSTDFGSLLLDGLGDGAWAKYPNGDLQLINNTLFGILQATGTRISKTEYISCPSCGRTLFDLQETTAKIRARTDHLKGVKIAIMGCIVNGPGEMADADYGYVGTGPGKITLYKGKEVVIRNVPSVQAVDALITLIKDNGDWVEESQ